MLVHDYLTVGRAKIAKSVLGTLLDVCRVVTRELSPFVPDGAARLTVALDRVDGATVAFPWVTPRPHLVT